MIFPIAPIVLTATQAGIPDSIAIDVLTSLLSSSGSEHCLSIDGKDPSANVVATLRNVGLLIEPASECHLEKVAEKRSEARTLNNAPASFFNLSELHDKGQGLMSISYWDRPATWEGSGATVTIKEVDGHWMVVGTSYLSVE